MKNIFLYLLSVLFIAIIGCKPEEQDALSWEISSPSGEISMQINFVEEDSSLVYNIFHTIRDTPVTVIKQSPLGVVRSDDDFSGSLRFVKVSDTREDADAYIMNTGKRLENEAPYKTFTLSFLSVNDNPLEIHARAYNDGVAFRYAFPDTSLEEKQVLLEQTAFTVPQNSVKWAMPYQEPAPWSPAYETTYTNASPAGTESGTKLGWGYPVLFKSGNHWFSVAEANVNRSYTGSRLLNIQDSLTYTLEFPNPEEIFGIGSIHPVSTLPWKTPWRVIIMGDSPGVILESNLIHHLSKPAVFEDFSQFLPGRASWSWWSDHNSPQDYNKLVPYIDLSAEMGLEYALIDANWNKMKNGDIYQLLDYAKEKEVGLILWYNSGGDHNEITEEPLDKMLDPDIRKEEFKKLNEMGVKGVKVDFFHSDKQYLINLYHDILQDAGDQGIFVVYHGCTMPRGWARTYPNLMSMEAVSGAEQYWSPDFARVAHTHHTILPFTRNMMGPMDYTPVTFTDDPRAPHKTTNSHELALGIAFESGVQHLADRDTSYLGAPDYVKEVLKELPVAWDDTRYVAGTPGEYVILARRKGDKWYLAALNGFEKPMDPSFSLDFLSEGTYSASIVKDGHLPRKFDHEIKTVTSSDNMQVMMLPRGGFSVVFTPIEEQN